MVNSSEKKAIVMYGASFLSVALGFLISILNTRILGPEKFGDFKYIETVVRLVASLVSVLSILPTATYAIIIYYLSQVIEVNIELVLLLYYGLLLLNNLFIIYKLKPSFKYGKELIQELHKENKFNGRPIYYGSLAGVATANMAGISISYFLNDNKQVGFFMLALTVCSPIINILGYSLLIKYFQMNGAIITKILASCLYLIVMLYYYINFTKKNNNV